MKDKEVDMFRRVFAPHGAGRRRVGRASEEAKSSAAELGAHGAGRGDHLF